MSKRQSSFVIQPFRRKYLKSYFDRMSKDNTNHLWDDNVASVLQEQGFSINESPRSVYKVDKLFEALAKYEPTKAPKVDMRKEEIQSGLRLAHTCFAAHGEKLTLKAFTPQLVYNITSNKKGSAGLTAWGQTKAESYVRAYERGLQQILGEKKPDPCVAFKRTQFDDKTRLVWGYPYAMTALEGIFARPLIDRFLQKTTPMAFGLSTGALGSRLRVSAYHYSIAYSTDVSSFDSSIATELIYAAFDILKTWFDLDQIEETSGVKYSVIWTQVVNYFIHTPIVMPDGNIYYGKRHGVPSGSYFTQIIDSIVNVIMVGAISHHFKMNVDKKAISVLGDDVLFFSNRDVTLSALSDFATRMFGAKFNEAKSGKFRHNDPIRYLGRIWEKGIPTLPIDDVLIRMTQPETFRKYDKDKAIRERQVRLLIMSYAAVYRSANQIYVRTHDLRGRWMRTLSAYQEFDYLLRDGKRAKSFAREVEVNPDFVSGLQRYLLKYHGSPGEIHRMTPLAMQFWS